jgi:hypothetical protein
MKETLEPMQEFYLEREEDISGTSGTGIVARGIVLPSGKCVLEWTSFHTSIAIYSNLHDIEAIHGHGGKTKVVLVQQTKRKKK